jgi:peptide deformylase
MLPSSNDCSNVSPTRPIYSILDYMAIRRIIRMGHPLLREVARPLEPGEVGGLEIERLLEDMVDTLHDYGGIGLAAPQIGESVRLAIVEIPGCATRYGELAPMSLGVFINPVIDVIDPAPAGYWEGCLSVPGLRGYVERPQHIKVSYTSEDGHTHEVELTGFPATVFQHEFDHLDGKLYLDRVTDTRLVAFEHEYERYLSPQVED